MPEDWSEKSFYWNWKRINENIFLTHRLSGTSLNHKGRFSHKQTELNKECLCMKCPLIFKGTSEAEGLKEYKKFCIQNIRI